MDQINQFKGQTRLPKFAVPKRYALTLKPDLSACTYSGTVGIDLWIVHDTKILVLNALELDIHEVWFTNSTGKQVHPSDVVLDKDDELLLLVFDEILSVGEGVLSIMFSGILTDNLIGFYRGTYVSGGEKKNMAATQFEPVEARRCFPCWDEPALKATFKVTVEDAPSELSVLSNMPAISEKFNGHFKTVCFDESPLMSTYLLAVVIGLFDYVEETTADGIKVRAFSPVGKSDATKFALDVAVKSLELYTKYFSMPYSLPKLDMVGLPDFIAGAMENYGLITFRETDLLYDELHSAAANKQRIAVVVAHEVAHQWFGNLVTMEWWTHLWLNEGFATWVSYLATDRLFPEWKVWTQFLQETIDGLSLDALEQSHPIEVEVQHVRLLDEIFDAISYEKGSAVIRMVTDYLGDDVFQKSLSSYMERYACKNAKTDDLWYVLSEESGVPVNRMMDKWTKQKGYPVISVKSKDHILEFEQSQFLSSGLCGDGKWIVPITFALGSYNSCHKFLLETSIQTIDLSQLFHFSDGNSSSFGEKNKEKQDEHLWVKVNVEQTGFYRVNDEKLLALLTKSIEENCLLPTDRFGMLDDTYALCEACELPLSSLLSLMDVFKKEIDYNVLSRLINISYEVLNISSNAIQSSVNDLKQFFINILRFSTEKLGWDPTSGESHLNALLRGEVFMALATFDHKNTCEEATNRFEKFLDDRNTPFLPADTRKAAYIAVARSANTTNRIGIEYLLKVYRESDAVQEKARILRCMASSPDRDILLEVLNFFLSGEIRDQDIVYGVAAISIEGRETAWRWLQDNWEIIMNKWGTGSLIARFIKGIVMPFCSDEKADEAEAFFETRTRPSFARTLKQSIERIRIKARWVRCIKQEDSLQELIKELACRE